MYILEYEIVCKLDSAAVNIYCKFKKFLKIEILL